MGIDDDDDNVEDVACGTMSVSGGNMGLGITREDRATTDQCIDRRVRLILFRLLNNGTIQGIGGCISTGKEANVYAAVSPEQERLAVKIYKSAILVFKDRQKYVIGEHRMRGGTVRPGNNLNMVVQWAEKEMRNLLRLNKAGIPCPRPIVLRKNVLVMTLVGEGEDAAPRLKDACVTPTLAMTLYRRLIVIMHAIYHDCRLVHADLSEYNILVHDGEPYIIDVSQSVERDHPMAFDFLRIDCRNVTAFFKKKGVDCLSIRTLFEFVVDESLVSSDDVERRIDELNQMEQDQDDDIVWEQTTVPRTLDELWDWDGDGARKEIGDSSALSSALKRMVVGSDEEESDETDDDSDDDEEKEWEDRPEGPDKAQRRAMRKAAKAEVKEEKRESRKYKMKKKVKQRSIKVSQRNRH
uniref:Serine/threonine-protein kinase RIO1 n=1 Tax=Spongospora subterranea TaxID=70186 RepID=A0A0H5RQY8_9EUKA|eukprot:CRZ11134.1 hypothetical protein [Spongospora subterranea]